MTVIEIKRLELLRQRVRNLEDQNAEMLEALKNCSEIYSILKLTPQDSAVIELNAIIKKAKK